MAYDESNNGTSVSSVYMASPNPSIFTGEDSTDEDNGGVINNLSLRQMSSQAEIIF